MSQVTRQQIPGDVAAQREDPVGCDSVTGETLQMEVSSSYDLEHGASPPGDGLSNTAVTFNFLKSILGAGVFTFPSVYAKAGFFFSLIILLICTWLIYYSARLLEIVASELRTYEYNKVFRYTVGRWAEPLPAFFIVIFVSIGLMGYCVIVGDSIPPVITSLFGYNDMEFFEKEIVPNNPAWKIVDRRVVLLLVVAFLILPLSLMRTLKPLAKTSILGVFCVFFVCIVSVVKTSLSYPDVPKYSNLNMTESPSELMTFIVDPYKIAGAVSACAFSNTVQYFQLAILRTPRDRSLKNKSLLLRNTLLGSTFVILLYSIPVYFNVGKGAIGNGNILNVFSNDDILINITRLVYSLNVILTFPILVFAIREVIVYAIHGRAPEVLRFPLFAAYTVVIVFSVVGVSLFFCDLGDVIDLAGGLAASFLTLIFPQVAYVIHKRRQNAISKTGTIMALSSALVGVAAVSLTIYDKAFPSSSGTGGGSGTCAYTYF